MYAEPISLWRSTDYGATWHKLFPVDNQIFNVNSIALRPIDNTQEIYVACEPLYCSQAASAVYFSPDNGATWRPIHDEDLGAIRWKGITVDQATGRIHAVSCGNGIFIADRV